MFNNAQPIKISKSQLAIIARISIAYDVYTNSVGTPYIHFEPESCLSKMVKVDNTIVNFEYNDSAYKEFMLHKENCNVLKYTFKHIAVMIKTLMYRLASK